MVLATGTVWAWSSGRAARSTLALQILDELRRPGPESWLLRATPPPGRSTFMLEGAGLRLGASRRAPFNVGSRSKRS